MSPSHVPLTTASIENLGFVRDDESNPQGIFHDGGGGASQGGYHVQVFADSMTESHGFNFVHNSISYFGHAARDPTNPLVQQKFGMQGPPGSRVFTGTALGAIDDSERALGPAFAIWLISSMTPMTDGKTILGVHPCLDAGKPENGDLYSTMVEITVVDPATLAAHELPPIRRLGSGKLFFPGEVEYGKFACNAGIDGYLYLFGADKTGFKLARTPNTPTTLADRNHYEYYSSATKSWQKDLLKKDDPTGNILDWSTNPMGEQLGADTGDVWYDPYHGTTMMIFMSKFVDGQFWASYSLENHIEGPWSEPVCIWTSPVPKECKGNSCGEYNYQGHAHPGWDPSGKTLLLSYSSCARYVSMAKVTWA